MKTTAKAWLINPWMDFAFFIATPLAIVPAYHLLAGLLSFNALKLGILSISATGHHLPGFIRAYTDRAIFDQFRARLLVVPALFVLLAGLAAWHRLSLIFFLLIVWSTWHGSMQILGFLRIYDLKAGFKSALTARLDFWMCLCWFIQVVLWSPSKKMSVLSSFYLAGGPLISVEWARWFEQGWLALTVALTAAYAGQTAYHFARRKYLHFPKLLCMAASFAFWGYCMISVENLILGLLLWEIFHDIQYNVFVWNYNKNRVGKNLSNSPLESFLFRPDWRRIGIYSVCIAAYGCIGLLTQDVFNVYQNRKAYESFLYQVGNVFAASALIHFYLDGFIWKVRDSKVQKDLGVQAAATYGKMPGLRHWAFVSLLFLAAAGLGASEYFHWNETQHRRQADNLADLVPASGYANFMKASFLKAENRPDSAMVYFERAIVQDTNYAFAHAFVADLKFQRGDLEGAVAHYEQAVRVDAEDEVIRGNLAELYLRTGRYEKAREQFSFLLLRDPGNAELHFQAAWTLLQMKRGLDAKPHLEQSLDLDPGQPRALNYLGMVEQALGNHTRALDLYRRSLDLDSTYAHARENLGAAERSRRGSAFPENQAYGRGVSSSR